MRAQRGATLIEGLVAIAIFSFGILAVVGMLATHIGTAADARYRTEAAQYAESILADMRISAPDTRATDFSADGTKFTQWHDRLTSAVGLPLAGTDADPLTIVYDNGNATVTIRWRAPSDRVNDPHQFTTSSFID